MDKKGQGEEELQRTLLYLAYIVIAVGILISLISFVNNAVSKTGLDEEYYARDIAFMLDLIESGNGDIEYKYEIEEAKFDFFVGEKDGENKVVVAKDLNAAGEGFGSKSYQYNGKQVFGRFVKPKELFIIRKNGRMLINDIYSERELRVEVA